MCFMYSPHSILLPPPLSGGGLDLNSSNRGCARLGSGVAPPLGVVKEEVSVLIVLVRRHRRAVGAAVRRAVDDEVPGAVEEETGRLRSASSTGGLHLAEEEVLDKDGSSQKAKQKLRGTTSIARRGSTSSTAIHRAPTGRWSPRSRGTTGAGCWSS